MNAEAKKRYKDIDLPFTCPVTNREFKSGMGLAIYLSKTLKVDHSEYYDQYINHRDNKCFFCGGKGKFISVAKGYRNLCDSEECTKKSFSSHTVEGIMYRTNCTLEEAKEKFIEINNQQLENRIKTQKKLRKEDPLWDKKRSRNCKEFWMEKGFSEVESIEKSKEVWKEIQEASSKKRRENKNDYLTIYPTKVEYWMNKGFTEEESISKISEIQNRFSLEKCIEKYGSDEGIRVFNERQKKWQKSLLDNGNLKLGYSKVSQDLFDILIKRYNSEDLESVFYATKNCEYSIENDRGGIYLYDFVDDKNMKIIEYNGDQYHANPKMYKEDDQPHPYHKNYKYSAKNIWEKDKRKIEVANKHGFEVLTIWDSEYKKDSDETLQRCLSFLNL